MTDQELGGVLLNANEEWQHIPRPIQDRLKEGVERIRSLRKAIASGAQVRQMPSVSIDPAIWTTGGGGLVHAASGIWPSIHGGHDFGVVVAAGPAICRDEAVLRAILVHEFAHCFMIATMAIESIDRGDGGLLDLTSENRLDETRENELLVNGADWFGPADAELIRWDDLRLGGVGAELVALANAGHLPVTEPPLRVRGRVIVPPEWAVHIRSLRQG